MRLRRELGWDWDYLTLRINRAAGVDKGISRTTLMRYARGRRPSAVYRHFLERALAVLEEEFGLVGGDGNEGASEGGAGR